MFSSTTIESSTSTPITMTSAIDDMMLSVNPRKLIARNVVMIEVGIANSTIIVLRRVCRNTSSTRPARMTASNRLPYTPFSELRVATELSLMIERRTPLGRSRLIRSISARTASTVAISLLLIAW